MEERLTFAVVAGEPSGDLIGGALIRAIRALVPSAIVCGIGGPQMASAGMDVWYSSDRLAVRGYVEVLRRYREITSIRRQLKARLLSLRPSVFVGIDAPDFNLPVELALRRSGIPTVHYVSPAIWAWRRDRLGLIERSVTHMLTVFPFEERIYENARIPATYVGHPLGEVLAQDGDRAKMREALRVSPTKPVVALLPGSRVDEVQSIGPMLAAAAKLVSERRPDTKFLVPLATRETRELMNSLLHPLNNGECDIKTLFGHAHDAMTASDLVVAASGTATMEAMMLMRPVVVTYRMPALSWQIIKWKKYLPYVGLPNILSGRFVVPEFIQDDARSENLAQAILNLLNDAPLRFRLEETFAGVRMALRSDASARAARKILDVARSRSSP